MARKNNHNLLECGFVESAFGKYEWRSPMFTIHVYIRESGWGAGVESANKTKWGEKEHDTAELAAIAVLDFLLSTEYVPLCKSEMESLRALIEEKGKDVDYSIVVLPKQSTRNQSEDTLTKFANKRG